MRILFINKNDIHGGAGIAMLRIADGLARYYGTENRIIVAKGALRRPDITRTRGRIGWMIEEAIDRITRSLGHPYRYFPVSPAAILREALLFKPDIIHLHNTHGGYFTHDLFEKLNALAPIVWTLHDMFSFTGHCAHSFDCDKWRTGCRGCPRLRDYPSLRVDRAAALLERKKALYGRIDPTIVTPSRWLDDLIGGSILRDKKRIVIPNGVDTDIFKPMDKNEARRALDLPQDKTVVLLGAYGGKSNRYKGGRFIERIVRNLSGRNDVLFLHIGGRWKGCGDNVVCKGRISGGSDMAACYAAADIYLFPSLAENCPLMVIESIACGTPVVAFATGGVPEIITHGENGYIARYADADDLMRGLTLLLDDPARRKTMGEQGRIKAREQFSLKVMADRYWSLFNETAQRLPGR